MKEMLLYKGNEILLRTNDIKLFNNLKKEFEYNIECKNYVDKEDIFTINVVNDREIYIRYFEEIKRNKEKAKCYCMIKRDNIVIFDKEHYKIFVIYDKYDDEKLHYISEIIFGIFGKKLEEQGYNFFHAACVAKKGQGILIFERNPGKRINLLLKLMLNNFDFISGSHVGIRREKENGIKAIGIPNRIGVSIGEIYSDLFCEKDIKKFRNLEDFKVNFLAIDERLLKTKYYEKKIDIKLPEIEEKLNSAIATETDVKLIIEINSKKINLHNDIIRRLTREEVIEIFMKNKRTGILEQVKYLNKIYKTKESSNKNIFLEKDFFKRMECYKVYQNSQKDMEQIVKFINRKIK